MDTLGNRIAARGLRGVSTKAESQVKSLNTAAIPVAASRVLNVGDNGALLVPSATITLTVPDGLPEGFSCDVAASAGTTSVARNGTATLNGAGTTLTRLFSTAANTQFQIKKSVNGAETYIVTGV